MTQYHKLPIVSLNLMGSVMQNDSSPLFGYLPLSKPLTYPPPACTGILRHPNAALCDTSGSISLGSARPRQPCHSASACYGRGPLLRSYRGTCPPGTIPAETLSGTYHPHVRWTGPYSRSLQSNRCTEASKVGVTGFVFLVSYKPEMRPAHCPMPLFYPQMHLARALYVGISNFGKHLTHQ